VRSWLTRPLGTILVAAAVALSGGGIYVAITGGGGGADGTANIWVASSPGSGCARSSTLVAYNSATDCTLADAVTAASNGDLILFKTGSYGAWAGTNKTITLKAETGQTPTMSASWGSGDSGFTVDGFSGMGGAITGTAADITIKNSTFSTVLQVEKSTTAALLLDGNTHWDIPVGSVPARITVWGTGDGVTIQNSLLGGVSGDPDGIRADGGNVDIIGNEFTQFRDVGANHADPIQFFDSDPNPQGNVVRGNYFHDMDNISSYIMMADGGSNHIIEDNVFAGRSMAHTGDAITWYSDTNSTIQHNTFEDSATGCGVQPSWSGSCGTMGLGWKSANNQGTGTVIKDNIISGVSNGGSGGTSLFTATFNMSPGSPLSGANNFTGTPTYVGGATPDSYEDYCLAPGSAGENAASDGLDAGIRC